MMDFLSIDIETTGLDPALHQMIEFGAVWSRVGIGDVTFRALIVYDNYVTDAYCAVLHQALFAEIVGVAKLMQEVDVVTIVADPTCREMGCRIENLDLLLIEWLEANGWAGEKLNVAGKNYPAFDDKWVGDVVSVPFRRRVLDPAMLWVQEGDSKLPNMDICMERAGIVIGDGRHTAVYDAECVVSLLRAAGI